MCVEGVSARADWDKPRLFKDKATQSALDRGDKERRYKRVRTQVKQLAAREGITRTAIRQCKCYGASPGLTEKECKKKIRRFESKVPHSSLYGQHAINVGCMIFVR